MGEARLYVSLGETRGRGPFICYLGCNFWASHVYVLVGIFIEYFAFLSEYEVIGYDNWSWIAFYSLSLR